SIRLDAMRLVSYYTLCGVESSSIRSSFFNPSLGGKSTRHRYNNDLDDRLSRLKLSSAPAGSCRQALTSPHPLVTTMSRKSHQMTSNHPSRELSTRDPSSGRVPGNSKRDTHFVIDGEPNIGLDLHQYGTYEPVPRA
ncbi:4797_t:CDS:2, partial [Acaulospora colombiana]